MLSALSIILNALSIILSGLSIILSALSIIEWFRALGCERYFLSLSGNTVPSFLSKIADQSSEQFLEMSNVLKELNIANKNVLENFK